MYSGPYLVTTGGKRTTGGARPAFIVYDGGQRRAAPASSPPQMATMNTFDFSPHQAAIDEAAGKGD